MLAKITEVPDIAESAYRSIMEQLVRVVLERLGLNDIIGENIVLNSFITAGQLSQNMGDTLNVRQNYCKADIEIITNTRDLPFGDGVAYAFSAIKHNPQLAHKTSKSIYTDNEDFVYLHEMDAQTGFRFEIELGFTSAKNKLYALQKFNNVLTNQIAACNVQYGYIIPNSVMYDILSLYIFSARDTDDFVRYLNEDASAGAIRLAKNKNISGNKVFMATRNMENVTLKFSDPSGPSDHEGSGASPDTHKVTFTVETQFNVVNSLALYSAIVIKNNWVEPLFNPIPYDEYIARAADGYHPCISMQAFNEWVRRPAPPDIYRAPWYDDWNASPTPDGYVPFAQTAFRMDGPGPGEFKTTLNLISDFKITQEYVLELIEKSGSDIFRSGAPALAIVYHNDDRMYSEKNFEYDPETKDLVVYGVGISGVYRLVLYLDTHSIAKNDAMRRLTVNFISGGPRGRI